MKTNLHDYYAGCAAGIEQVYQSADRQAELQKINSCFERHFSDQNVLEIACGSGYWTERLAQVAKSVLATDNNATMLSLAQAKTYPRNNVTFQQADAFSLPEGHYTAALAGCWWAHMKRSQQSEFLTNLQKLCGSGAQFIMFDNCYVEGVSTPIARTDSEGNTYQIRRLADDSRHEVLKNYPTDSTLRKKLVQHARDIRVVRGTYYWMLTCVLR